MLTIRMLAHTTTINIATVLMKKVLIVPRNEAEQILQNYSLSNFVSSWYKANAYDNLSRLRSALIWRLHTYLNAAVLRDIKWHLLRSPNFKISSSFNKMIVWFALSFHTKCMFIPETDWYMNFGMVGKLGKRTPLTETRKSEMIFNIGLIWWPQ